jgi:hypothetical protein
MRQGAAAVSTTHVAATRHSPAHPGAAASHAKRPDPPKPTAPQAARVPYARQDAGDEARPGPSMHDAQRALHLLGLQQTVGNRAVQGLLARPAADTVPVQRAKPRPSGVPPAVRRRRQRAQELGAMDVQPLLASKLPAVLAILTPEQVDQFQRVIDAKAINAWVDKETTAITSAHEEAPYSSEFRPRLAALEREKVPDDQGDRYLTLDATRLFDADVLAPPAANVADEMKFRDWMYRRIERGGVRLRLGEASSGHGLVDTWTVWLSLGPYDDAISDRSGGVLNMATLLDCGPIAVAYNNMVLQGPGNKAVEQLRDQLFAAIQAAQRDHFEDEQQRDEALAPVVWETEWLGGADFPPTSIWDDVYKLYMAAAHLDAKGQTEAAYRGYATAFEAYQQAANRLYEFERRKEERLGGAVKWLKRAEWAGTMAATIASGGMAAEAGLGLAATSEAIAEGGAIYGGVKEGLQQASEVGLGERKNLDVGKIGKEMVTEYVLGKVGASIGGRTSHWIAEAAGLEETSGLTRILGGGLTHAMGAVATSPVVTTLSIAINALTGGEVPEGSGAMLALYLERAKDAAVEGGLMGAAMSTGKAVEAQEARRVSELMTDRQEAWLDRVNRSAVKAWNEGGSWEADEVAVRNLAEQAANRLRRGALPDGTRANLPKETLDSMADRLTQSIEDQINAARNMVKVVKGPPGTVDRGSQSARGVDLGWQRWP